MIISVTNKQMMLESSKQQVFLSRKLEKSKLKNNGVRVYMRQLYMYMIMASMTIKGIVMGGFELRYDNLLDCHAEFCHTAYRTHYKTPL